MKKQQTLEELIKERGLKPRNAETFDGRHKTKNGYSYVYINEKNEYITFDELDLLFLPDRYKEVVLVRG